MINIRPDQHAKILGIALIGYGLQFFPATLRLLAFWWRALGDEFASTTGGLFYILYAGLADNYQSVLLLLVSLVAGVSFLSIRSRSNIPGVLFVFAVIALFPLGTLLSFYVLYYVFVVKENSILEP